MFSCWSIIKAPYFHHDRKILPNFVFTFQPSPFAFCLRVWFLVQSILFTHVYKYTYTSVIGGETSIDLKNERSWYALEMNSSILSIGFRAMSVTLNTRRGIIISKFFCGFQIFNIIRNIYN